jgi:hypothetical protein
MAGLQVGTGVLPGTWTPNPQSKRATQVSAHPLLKIDVISLEIPKGWLQGGCGFGVALLCRSTGRLVRWAWVTVSRSISLLLVQEDLERAECRAYYRFKLPEPEILT